MPRARGVSAAAPDRHFRDARRLLADWRARASSASRRCLSTAGPAGKPDPLHRFNMSAGPPAFARAEPAYYAAMFESGLPPDLNPDLRAAAIAPRRAAHRGRCPGGHAGPPASGRLPLMMSLHVWSMAPASLAVRPRRCRPASPPHDRRRLLSNRSCSSICKGWVFPKKPEGVLTPLGGMPNVNVVNI